MAKTLSITEFEQLNSGKNKGKMLSPLVAALEKEATEYAGSIVEFTIQELIGQPRTNTSTLKKLAEKTGFEIKVAKREKLTKNSYYPTAIAVNFSS